VAFHSANGSKLVIGVTTLHCTNVNLIKQARLVENTNSANSSSNYVPVIKDHSWSADVPWDDTNLPDTDFGLTEGAQVTLVFNEGATSGKTATLTATTVERLETMMNNEQDIVRCRVSGKGGALTREVT